MHSDDEAMTGGHALSSHVKVWKSLMWINLINQILIISNMFRQIRSYFCVMLQKYWNIED